ncbi:MAG: D-glycero-beta-D-manno-heptose 1,7-bisphosphate 7-phosphatase [Gammaproteobacteria bacterium]|nr:MAG: D-glycero-beta-D-manno-heptose 1,7-bisphosphate 7-phosphatase [Gammaproteobacteria bacterium]
MILDRDGVINADTVECVRSVSAWQPLPGSLEALAQLRRAGWQVVVATNQSGVARGLLSRRELASIHEHMCGEVNAAGGAIGAIASCTHGPEECCGCRKPAPGLIHQLESRLGRSLQDAPFVGDAERDLQAARAAGCRPVLVRTGKGRRTEKVADLSGVTVYDDLRAFVRCLLGETSA